MHDIFLCISDKLLAAMNQTEVKKYSCVFNQSIYSLYLKWSLT